MGTSNFEIDPPPDATDEEAAAIAAAIAAHLSGEARSEPADSTEEGGIARSWRFAGRIEALRERSVRVPRGAPDEPWRVIDRVDRR